jgi:ribosome biogenesis GTPase
MITREIRQDDGRGRHATAHRELFLLASGALVLDTPGMREFGLWDAGEGVDETFAEIVELADRCRFTDCSHKFEPGCEVRAAVAGGRLDEARLKSYRRLAHELAEQPSPAQRRERARRFQKAVRNASSDSIARKRYTGWA